MSCEDVLDCLLVKIQQEDRIRLLWSLLEDRDQDNKALYILLVKIGQLAPNIPKHVLKDLLDKQAITTNILLKVNKRERWKEFMEFMDEIFRAAIIRRLVYEEHGCKPLLAYTRYLEMTFLSPILHHYSGSINLV